MTGMRKIAFGSMAFILTWVWLMWGQNLNEKDHEAGLVLQGSIVAAVIGGNAYEHRQRRKAVQTGVPTMAPADGPGTTPAADSGIGSPTETSFDEVK